MKMSVVFELLMFYVIHQFYVLNNHFVVRFRLIVFEVHQFVVRNEDVELVADVSLMKTNRLYKINERLKKNRIQSRAKDSEKKTFHPNTIAILSYHPTLL